MRIEEVFIPMRDGVRLATDIYFPIQQSPSAILLHRTPYNKTEVESNAQWPSRFASHGYIAIVQDCRGCFRSEGDVAFLEPEDEDGKDTLAWIAQQSWGKEVKVGWWGTSWAGWVQTAASAKSPKNLRSIVPNQSGCVGIYSP